MLVGGRVVKWYTQLHVRKLNGGRSDFRLGLPLTFIYPGFDVGWMVQRSHGPAFCTSGTNSDPNIGWSLGVHVDLQGTCFKNLCLASFKNRPGPVETNLAQP